MVLSKLLIGFHCKVLAFTGLFYFHFAEKCVTFGQDFYSKFFRFHVLGRIQLFLSCIRIICYGQLKETSFYYVEERFFIAGIKICRESSSNRPKKQFPNSNYLRKQTLKSRIVLFKLCKKNLQMHSKILDVSFSIQFCLETKQVVLLLDFVHLHIAIRPHIFSTYNDTRSFFVQ